MSVFNSNFCKFNALLAAAGFFLIAGCNKNNIERATVTGKVTLDGKPIPTGQIRFIPTGETSGPAWTAWIKDGHYTTEGTRGAPIGDLRVEIMAYRVPADFQRGASTDPTDSEAYLPREQYLPAKYNSRSELKLTIEPGNTRVEKNFDLDSR